MRSRVLAHDDENWAAFSSPLSEGKFAKRGDRLERDAHGSPCEVRVLCLPPSLTHRKRNWLGARTASKAVRTFTGVGFETSLFLSVVRPHRAYTHRGKSQLEDIGRKVDGEPHPFRSPKKQCSNHSDDCHSYLDSPSSPCPGGSQAVVYEAICPRFDSWRGDQPFLSYCLRPGGIQARASEARCVGFDSRRRRRGRPAAPSLHANWKQLYQLRGSNPLKNKRSAHSDERTSSWHHRSVGEQHPARLITSRRRCDSGRCNHVSVV